MGNEMVIVCTICNPTARVCGGAMYTANSWGNKAIAEHFRIHADYSDGTKDDTMAVSSI
ncbi:hypothetical protein OHS59_16305 [Streptomyces sp. NBC_00414]|uniref:hypothetical protein n=1 Tax=Streptomyces sp. NBC_00414 TaxID=2975739 RepID=UPI002E1DF574